MITTLVQVGAAALGLAVMSAVVLQSSTAAFSGTTDTQGGWTAATVSLSDDDGGAVAFSSPAAMVPHDQDQACITVTYHGDVDAEVRLYGTSSASTGLEAYLDLTVEEITGDCAAPTTVAPIFSSGTSASFVTSHTGWADGATTSWNSVSPATSGATKVFRFTVKLQDMNDAQSKTTTTTFTWEAQNV